MTSQEPGTMLLLTQQCPFPRPEAITIERFQRIKRLGGGAISEVFLVQDTLSGLRCVLKAYHKPKLTASNRKHILREVELHSALTNSADPQASGLVKLYGVAESESDIVFLMEHVEGGDLFKERNRRGRFSEQAALEVVGQVATSLAFLHSKGVAHRDLKPENILIEPGCTRGAGPLVKLCDLGLSINCALERPVTRLGTVGFMPPEVINNKKDGVFSGYDAEKVDSFALGCLAYELLFGRGPFEGPDNKDTTGNVLSGVFLIPQGVSQEARAFISAALARNPEERPTMRQLAAHPWLLRGSRGSLPVPQPQLHAQPQLQARNSARALMPGAGPAVSPQGPVQVTAAVQAPSQPRPASPPQPGQRHPAAPCLTPVGSRRYPPSALSDIFPGVGAYGPHAAPFPAPAPASASPSPPPPPMSDASSSDASRSSASSGIELTTSPASRRRMLYKASSAGSGSATPAPATVLVPAPSFCPRTPSRGLSLVTWPEKPSPVSAGMQPAPVPYTPPRQLGKGASFQYPLPYSRQLGGQGSAGAGELHFSERTVHFPVITSSPRHPPSLTGFVIPAQPAARSLDTALRQQQQHLTHAASKPAPGALLPRAALQRAASQSLLPPPTRAGSMRVRPNHSRLDAMARAGLSQAAINTVALGSQATAY